MTTHRKYTIATIDSRSACGDQLLLTFSNGMEATFAKADPAYEMCLRHASLNGGSSPVGLVVEPPNRITSLTWTMNMKPGRFGEQVKLPRDLAGSSRYAGYYLIVFAGPCGVYRLAPDHPEFERIVSTLQQAKQQDRELCVSFLPDLLVLDVQLADSFKPGTAIANFPHSD